MPSARAWLARRGAAAGVLAAALLACDPPRYSSGCPGIPDWPGPTPLAVPAGFGTLDAHAWTALRDSAWSYLRRSSSRDDDICRDPSAHPPRTALRIVFTPDMRPNTEPSVHWIRLPHLTAVYAAWDMRLSPNWTGSPAGGGKIVFLHADSGGQVYANIGGSRAPHHIDVNTEWAPYGSKFWEPNVDSTPVVYGRWYRIEWYAQWSSTPGAADGVLRWWVDGVLNGDYADVEFPFPAGFSQFEFAPTRQQPPPDPQYMYVAHTTLAAAPGDVGRP